MVSDREGERARNRKGAGKELRCTCSDDQCCNVGDALSDISHLL
jgi:hypothetical protein